MFTARRAAGVRGAGGMEGGHAAGRGAPARPFGSHRPQRARELGRRKALHVIGVRLGRDEVDEPVDVRHDERRRAEAVVPPAEEAEQLGVLGRPDGDGSADGAHGRAPARGRHALCCNGWTARITQAAPRH